MALEAVLHQNRLDVPVKVQRRRRAGNRSRAHQHGDTREKKRAQ
jgi:hypothetical protein